MAQKKGAIPFVRLFDGNVKRLTIEYRDLGIAAAGNQPPVLGTRAGVTMYLLRTSTRPWFGTHRFAEKEDRM
jgi:hypothetical protein